MRPFSTKELDEIRKAVDGGHHLEFVERLMATIDSLERKNELMEAKIKKAVEAFRSLSDEE